MSLCSRSESLVSEEIRQPLISVLLYFLDLIGNRLQEFVASVFFFDYDLINRLAQSLFS